EHIVVQHPIIGQVEGIVQKVVMLKDILITGPANFYAPAVPYKIIVGIFYTVRALYTNAHCIFLKGIADDLAIVDLFQQKSERGRTPILFKGIAHHIYPLRKHDRYSCPIVLKGIALIGVVVGEHKMQSVADILGADVVLYGYEI